MNWEAGSSGQGWFCRVPSGTLWIQNFCLRRTSADARDEGKHVVNLWFRHGDGHWDRTWSSDLVSADEALLLVDSLKKDADGILTMTLL